MSIVAFSEIEIVGMLAAGLTTGAFVPQVFKIWKTRDTAAISTGMYSSFTVGVAMWLLYGLLIGSISVILSNGLTFLLSGTVLALKMAQQRQQASP